MIFAHFYLSNYCLSSVVVYIYFRLSLVTLIVNQDKFLVYKSVFTTHQKDVQKNPKMR